MPDAGDHLGSGGVLKAEIVDERDDSGGVRGPLSVLVSPFGGVSKERRIAKRVRFFPVPLPWIPGEVFDEAGFKNPEGSVFLVGGGRVSGDFEGGSVSFLGENSDRGEVEVKKGVNLVARGLELAASRNSSEF